MSRNTRFKNKVIIVTGAAQGIGEGVAMAIAREGGKLILADRSPLVHDVARNIKENDGEAQVILADLETWEGANSIAQKTLELYGRIDISIHNVGGTIWAKPYQEYAPEEIMAEVNRSLFPTLWSCRAVLPSMIKQQSGVIVNISSIATRSIHRIPYAASKGGVNAMTMSLAMEHAHNNIRINAIATGGTEAPARKIPRNPKPLSEQETSWYQAIIDQTVASSLMQRYGTIQEQVNAILFLASDEASYITGTVLPVGGGDLGMG
ncbi:MAG: 1,6-dihydroxycyclohexa-2,4-diene-1-carboxylate dehydrogenase [Alcaligenaceae bacterium]|nr:1,6-dihydroxycyclohexa-2,4-diene-1-carboxylate dehydrogenase [Alcaligenaceae bacterium]